MHIKLSIRNFKKFACCVTSFLKKSLQYDADNIIYFSLIIVSVIHIFSRLYSLYCRNFNLLQSDFTNKSDLKIFKFNVFRFINSVKASSISNLSKDLEKLNISQNKTNADVFNMPNNCFYSKYLDKNILETINSNLFSLYQIQVSDLKNMRSLEQNMIWLEGFTLLKHQNHTDIFKIETVDKGMYILKRSTYRCSENYSEAQLALELNHKYVVKTYCIFEEEIIEKYGNVKQKTHVSWLLMEFCNKKVYMDNIDNIEGFIRKFVSDILQAIEYLHEKNYVHYDITEDNIMGVRNKKGEITYKLIDFGTTIKVEDKEEKYEDIKAFEQLVFFHYLNLREKYFCEFIKNKSHNFQDFCKKFHYGENITAFELLQHPFFIKS